MIKAFNVTKSPKYDWYQGGLTSMVYKFFDKKVCGGTVNKEFAEELHKPIFRNFKKC